MADGCERPCVYLACLAPGVGDVRARRTILCYHGRMSTQTAQAAALAGQGKGKTRETRAERRSHPIYISVDREFGEAIREVSDLLGISMSEAGNEAFALWLAARRKEFAKGLTPAK